MALETKTRGQGARTLRHRWTTARTGAVAIMGLIGLITPGCADVENEWLPLMHLQAEIADGLADTYCSVRRLISPGGQSSDFADRADPELIELARRDAYRACLKGLEANAEERARRLPGRNNI